MKLIRFFLVFLSITGYYSCKPSQLSIVKPVENYEQVPAYNTTSTLGISMDIKIPELEKSINGSFKGLLYEDNNFVDDNMLIKIWKTNDFKFTIQNNTINYKVPLKIWLKTGFKKEVLGVTVQDYYEANGALVLNITSSFQIDKNWNLTTNSKLNKLEWTQEPVFNAMGLNIPVTTITNLVVKAFNSKITDKLDKTISEKADLRNTLQTTWKGLYEPIKVNEPYNVWLKMQPKNLMASPIVGTGNKLSFNVGVSSIIETYVGLQPTKCTTQTNLPDYKPTNNIKPEFSIHSNISVPYKKLSELASQFVVGQEFKKGRKKVKIDSIDIFGQGDKILVKVNVSGSVNGAVYCIGKPTYNKENQSLVITEFDFEMDTKSKLLKSANWLMHNQFLKLIEPMLTISLTDQINEMMKTSNEMLKNYQCTKGVYLNGKLNTIELDHILVTKESLIIEGNINGNLKVDVKDIF